MPLGQGISKALSLEPGGPILLGMRQPRGRSTDHRFYFLPCPGQINSPYVLFSFLAQGRSTEHIFCFLPCPWQIDCPEHTSAWYAGSLPDNVFFCNQSYIVFPNRYSRLRFSQKKGFGPSLLRSNRIPSSSSSSSLSSLAKNCSGKKSFFVSSLQVSCMFVHQRVLSAGFCVYWWELDFCCGGSRARVSF